jgi:hypothetical protein
MAKFYVKKTKESELKPKQCKQCGKTMKPNPEKNFTNWYNWEKRKFCDHNCTTKYHVEKAKKKRKKVPRCPNSFWQKWTEGKY